MRQKISLSILGLSLLLLTGCNFLEAIKEYSGVYVGQSEDGVPCQAEIRMLPPITGVCQWVTISIFRNEDSNRNLSLKKYCVTNNAAFNSVNYSITQGDQTNPQQIVVEKELQIDIQNLRLRSLIFLDKNISCRRLELKN